jgi:DNA-binding NtrC family response regulator
MQEVRRQVARAAAADCNILISGETGTGKELVAELVHQQSARRAGPFICVNCAALPETLLETELFGHERGAFTGAAAQTEGKLKLADGGTILFDEIGDMSLGAQTKLLRAIETRSFYRVGGQRPVPVNIRILAATHRDLRAMADAESFRRDLYYRLNVARIDLPPLRSRPSDVGPLLSHYLRQFTAARSRAASRFSEALTTQLTRYAWPGNVRELRNLVEATFVFSSSREFTWTDLPAHFRDIVPAPAETASDERTRLLGVLRETRWNKSRAAAALQWSRMTLYRKLAKYAIDPARPDRPVSQASRVK